MDTTTRDDFLIIIVITAAGVTSECGRGWCEEFNLCGKSITHNQLNLTGMIIRGQWIKEDFRRAIGSGEEMMTHLSLEKVKNRIALTQTDL